MFWSISLPELAWKKIQTNEFLPVLYSNVFGLNEILIISISFGKSQIEFNLPLAGLHSIKSNNDHQDMLNFAFF